MDTSNIYDQSKAVLVLLVDDDTIFAKIVQAFLQKYRQRTFTLIWKDSVESALTEIKQNHEPA
jgi:ActR/RegA family two-component response regulator